MASALERLWPFIILLVVLIWGGPKLPGMAKNLAQSLKIFRKEMKNDDDKGNGNKPTKEDDKSND